MQQAQGTRHMTNPISIPMTSDAQKSMLYKSVLRGWQTKTIAYFFGAIICRFAEKEEKKGAKIYILAVHRTCMCLQVHVCAGCNCYIDGRAFWFVDCVNLEAAKKNIYLHLLIAMCEAINKFCGREKAFYSHSDGGGAMPFKSYSKQ